MKTVHFIGTVMLALVLFAAACSPQATPTAAPTDTEAAIVPTDTVAPPTDTAMPAPGDTETPTAAPVNTPSGPATVTVSQNDTLGSFLVDDKGMTLYLYTKDSPNTTVCYGKCATAWPPLLTNGAPVAGDGADSTKLGTITRTDGTTQVTYNGWPLYYYVKDMKAGDTTGQNVGSVWYVLSPAGEMIDK